MIDTAINRLKLVIDARENPGKWVFAGANHSQSCLSLKWVRAHDEGGLPTDYPCACGADSYMRAIVAMDHIIDPALAVVEAAQSLLEAALSGAFDEATTTTTAMAASREHFDGIARALAAFDAAVEEATR